MTATRVIIFDQFHYMGCFQQLLKGKNSLKIFIFLPDGFDQMGFNAGMMV